MSIEEKARKLLEKSPYGLSASEVSSKIDINEVTASKILDRMASGKKIKKSKVGKTFLYKGTKYISIFLLVLMLFGTAEAQKMDSTSYNLTTVLDSAGSLMRSTSYIAYGSVGQVSGLTNSVAYDLCAGFLCNFIEFITNPKVSFLLHFNISGNADDVVFVDNFTTLKQYRASSLVNYYACLHDPSISGTPTFGIIFAGTTLNYINVSSGNSYIMKISQEIPGNEFVIPITQNNCTVFNARMPQISQFGKVLQPFVLINEAVNAIELSLEYAAIDIAGNLDRTGSFTLEIEKNETNENQIIIKPV